MDNTLYIDRNTKEKVRITEDNGQFLTLNNGTKIDKLLFNQRYIVNTVATPSIQIQQPIINDVIDPVNFLNSPTNISGTEKLLEIDPSKIIDNAANQTTVKFIDNNSAIISNNKSLEEQKREMLEKYNNQNNYTQHKNFNYDENDDRINNIRQQVSKKPLLNENGLTETQEMLRQDQIQLTGVDPFEQKIKKYKESLGMQTNTQPVNNITQNNNQNINQINDNNVNDFFKKFKRNHNIKIKLVISEKISKPDFIKIMADGLDGDIIQYYTDEIFKSFMNNQNNLKSEIYNQIYKEVYGYDFEPEQTDEISENETELLEGKLTKAGKQTYKYIKNGKVVEMLPSLAKKQNLLPAKKTNN